MSANPNYDPRVVFDLDSALAGVGDDLELLSEMAELFLSEVAGLIEQIRLAARGRDGQALGRAAHQLNGAASNFYAHATVEAALRLERIGWRTSCGTSRTRMRLYLASSAA